MKRRRRNRLTFDEIMLLIAAYYEDGNFPVETFTENVLAPDEDIWDAVKSLEDKGYLVLEKDEKGKHLMKATPRGVEALRENLDVLEREINRLRKARSYLEARASLYTFLLAYFGILDEEEAAYLMNKVVIRSMTIPIEYLKYFEGRVEISEEEMEEILKAVEEFEEELIRERERRRARLMRLEKMRQEKKYKAKQEEQEPSSPTR